MASQEEKVKALFQQAADGAKAVFESAKYREYLVVMAKFHRYSANNILLIKAQCPHATCVAGFQAWRTKFGRQVQQGEHGIQILARVDRRITKIKEETDESGNTIKKPVTREIHYYKPAYVYDVSQTDGRPLPRLVNELDGSVHDYQSLMSTLSAVAPYPIAFEPIPGETKGYCNYQEKKIAIKAGMSEVQTAKTAVHEIAHALLHAPEQGAAAGTRPDQSLREVQAESVAFVICNHYGIDTSDYSFPYIALWSRGKTPDECNHCLKDIQQTASQLISAIDTGLEKRNELSRLDSKDAAGSRGMSDADLFDSDYGEPAMGNADELPAREKPHQRLYVDMDGTLAVFTPANKLEDLYEQGYFANLKPIDNVVAAVKTIIKEHPEIEVNILSAHLSDSPFALAEKNAWLDRYLPEVDSEHRIFPPCGQNKKDFIPGGIRRDDYLLDDYTHNLAQWEPPAKGIKLLNGINHTRGTWQSDRIRCNRSPQELADGIVSVMQGQTRIMDEQIILKQPADAPQEHIPDMEQPAAEALPQTEHTTATVLAQRDTVVQLQWSYPNGAIEYSVHHIDDALKIKNGTYFDARAACDEHFKQALPDVGVATKTPEGQTYRYDKGALVLPAAKPENRPQANSAKEPAEAPYIQRITSFVREIRMETVPAGTTQYFGYCNGVQETDGYDTIDDLISHSDKFSRHDFINNDSPSPRNICSLYFSDGSVQRISGAEHGVDFSKMPAGRLKQFVDQYLTQEKAPAPHAPRHTGTMNDMRPAKPRYTKEQYEAAQNTNLFEYMRAAGYNLTPAGPWHRWKDHPSFAVHDNGRWHWFSQELGGGPIDFLVKCENRSFVEAVHMLAGDVRFYIPDLKIRRQEQAQEEKPPLELPPAAQSSKHVLAYLIKTRGLDEKIVKELIKEKRVYESERLHDGKAIHNAVFVGYDKEGTPKYAAQRGTGSAPFKRDVYGTDKSYGFQMPGTSQTRVAVFEAPIDAISHKCIEKLCGMDYEAINRITLGGTSMLALERYLQEHVDIKEIVIGTDNDVAGQGVAQRIKEKYEPLGYTVTRLLPRAKDFNEDLMNIRSEQVSEASHGAQHEPPGAAEEMEIE